MKPGIHPSYQAVIFHDTAANHSFLTRSAIDTSHKKRGTNKATGSLGIAGGAVAVGAGLIAYSPDPLSYLFYGGLACFAVTAA